MSDLTKSDDDESPIESPSPTETQTSTPAVPKRRFGRNTLLAVVGALVVFSALGWGGYTTWQHSLDNEARTTALESGRQFATDLATYNFANLDQNLSVVRENSVGEFAGQYAQVAANLQDMIVQYQATSSAQIISAGLAGSDRDSAEVLVFLDQTITNTNSLDPVSIATVCSSRSFAKTGNGSSARSSCSDTRRHLPVR